MTRRVEVIDVAGQVVDVVELSEVLSETVAALDRLDSKFPGCRIRPVGTSTGHHRSGGGV